MPKIRSKKKGLSMILSLEIILSVVSYERRNTFHREIQNLRKIILLIIFF